MTRLALTAAVALLLAGCAGATDGNAEPGTTTTATSSAAASPPRWWFTDTNGTLQSHGTTVGNVSLLFFMATWCSSCKSKAPDVRQIQQDYADQGLLVLSIGTDPRESDEKLDNWRAAYDQPWPHGVDRNQSVVQTFEVVSQSTLVVLDRDGTVVERFGYYGGGSGLASVRDAIDSAYAGAGDP